MSTTIPIYFMGKKYMVPEGLTILPDYIRIETKARKYS